MSAGFDKAHLIVEKTNNLTNLPTSPITIVMVLQDHNEPTKKPLRALRALAVQSNMSQEQT